MGSNFETLSAYECGFEPMSQNARMKYSIIYWLIGILYLIFDLELIILIPMAIHFSYMTYLSLISFFIFLFILIVGYIYEWKTGSLNLS
jgi:NADH-quinone oxidoreductase subunit A